ncbi:MAG: GNAT family N-acetyltransferase [Actinomycetota bacterium]|nr:GNAT family N-acetyltransferase [Actinomycetota bacterium]
MPSYELDDDPGRVDVDAVWNFLSTSAYWGRWREESVVRRQVATAWRVVGAYHTEWGMVGFARAISDGVALAYLADVFVLPDHRGRGLGLAVVRRMVEEGPGARFRWLLHTRDGHGLYAKLGFAPPDLTLLERPATLDPTAPSPSRNTNDTAGD